MQRGPQRQFIIKMPKFKDKERILKTTREKQLVIYKRAFIGLSADFSTETLQARRVWHKILTVMKSKDLQPRLIYPEKLSFRIKKSYEELPRQEKV